MTTIITKRVITTTNNNRSTTRHCRCRCWFKLFITMILSIIISLVIIILPWEGAVFSAATTANTVVMIPVRRTRNSSSCHSNDVNRRQKYFHNGNHHHQQEHPKDKAFHIVATSRVKMTHNYNYYAPSTLFITKRSNKEVVSSSSSSRNRSGSKIIIPSIISRRRQRRPFTKNNVVHYSSILLASTTTTSSQNNRQQTANNNSNNYNNNQLQQQDSDIDELSYDDLTLFGRIIAGTTEIVFTTALEYVSGFFGGYFLGSITGIPSFLTKPMNQQPGGGSEQLMRGTSSSSFFHEMSQRTIRMHTKSFKWAHNWGSISAAFGGFRVVTKVLRGGVEDEWNTIFSSFAAGAYFARKDGPQAMLRGAVMYGGLMYLLSGGGAGKKKQQPFEYQEQEIIDF